jgi:hypothetical protein
MYKIIRIIEKIVIPILTVVLKKANNYNNAVKCPHCGKFHK